MFAEHKSPEALEKSLRLCRGCYQRNVVLGVESLSGSTLRGRARNYSMRYAESRRSLLGRLQQAGIGHEETREHGKRVLVIG